MTPSSSAVPARILTGLLTGTAVCALATGCGTFEDPHQKALEYAAQAAEERAEEVRDWVEDALRAKSPFSPADLEDLTERFSRVPENEVVFAHAIEANGSIRLDAAFTAQRTTTAGFGGSSTRRARVCVRITGHPGPEAKAKMANTHCAPDLPDADQVTIVKLKT